MPLIGLGFEDALRRYFFGHKESRLYLEIPRPRLCSGVILTPGGGIVLATWRTGFLVRSWR